MQDRVVEHLSNIVGHKHITRRARDGITCVRPGSTEELSRCLAVLDADGVKATTIGGDTGLVGGTQTWASGIVISTDRLAEIRPVDATRQLIVAGAGAKLQTVQDAARDAGLRVGLDLGARGSCSIGGNVATNAGGSNVVRYGMLRRDVVGLEVVLADGTILSDLGGLTKNNTGYDLKQLFIGSEGTLGVITQVALALHPVPKDTMTALLGFDSVSALIAAAGDLRRTYPGAIVALEAMWPSYFDTCAEAVAPGQRIIGAAAVYLLVEIEAPQDAEAKIAELEGLVGGTIAQNEAQAAAFWAIRDASEVVETRYPAVHSYDVSLLPSDFEGYLATIDASLEDRFPEAQNYVFGHLGDGNIHFVIGFDDPSAQAKAALDEIVYAPLTKLHPSSISAEHGIGVEKARHLWRTRSASEIDVMNRIRTALDPRGTLNPHIVFSTCPETTQAHPKTRHSHA
jgi:FAD/FMN-containing dehydrogenase